MHTDCYHKMYEVEERHWWFQGKAALAEMLLKKLGPGPKRILDIGCGTGSFSRRLLAAGHAVTSLDANPLALEYCRKRGLTDVVEADAGALPFPEHTFDAVVALDILEHLDDDRAALAEWARVLKPGGVLVVFVPAFKFLWGPQDDKLQHKRRYTARELRSALSYIGSVERVSYFNTLLFLPVLCVRMMERAFPRLLRHRDELDLTNPFLNAIFGRIFRFEIRLLRRRNFPFGVSVLAVARTARLGAPQVSVTHYAHATYDHKARWLSYWYQIRAVLESKPASLLEVGLGNGLVTNYLMSQGVTVTTLDIDPALKPDLAGSVTAIPFPDNAVDVALAAEVLEHIPFDEVPQALRELRRVARRRVVISVPDSRHTLLSFEMKIPLLPRVGAFMKMMTRKAHAFDGQHYWELGKRGYPLRRIEKIIADAGLVIVRHFVPADCPTKHFFILTKK